MHYEIVELEIDVSELQLGMHVVRLDCAWEDTDFLFQGFIVQSRDDIDALQMQCRKVVIEGKVRRELDAIPQAPLDKPDTAYFQRVSTDSGQADTAKNQEKITPERPARRQACYLRQQGGCKHRNSHSHQSLH